MERTNDLYHPTCYVQTNATFGIQSPILWESLRGFDSYSLKTDGRSHVKQITVIGSKIREKRTGIIFQIMSLLSLMCGYFINIKHTS